MVDLFYTLLRGGLNVQLSQSKVKSSTTDGINELYTAFINDVVVL